MPRVAVDGAARVWDAHTGNECGVVVGYAGPEQAGKGGSPGLAESTAAFSPDGSRVFAAGVDVDGVKPTHPCVWGPETGELVVAFEGLSPYHVYDAVFSADGTLVAVVDGNTWATSIWRVETGERLSTLIGGQLEAELTFSPDGRRLLTAGSSGNAAIWDVASGEVVCTLVGHTELVRDTAFSSVGDRVVTGCWDGVARIWDVETGRLDVSLGRHGGIVTMARLSPDDAFVATASDDSTARVWDANAGQPITLPLQHSDRVVKVAFTPDSQHLLAVSSGTPGARVWDISPDARLARDLRILAELLSAQHIQADGAVTATSPDTYADAGALAWIRAEHEELFVPTPEERSGLYRPRFLWTPSEGTVMNGGRAEP